MGKSIDYFKQIARGNIVTEDILKKRYNEFSNFIYKLKASDVDRIQELIQIKFDYLVPSKFLEGYTAGLSYQELEDDYIKTKEKVLMKKKEFNDKAKIRNESVNPYRNLSVPQNAENYKINTSYGLQITNLKKELEKEEEKTFKDLDKIISLYAYYLLFKEAREILLDKKMRRKSDEEISLGFNSNQEDYFSKNMVSNVKFIPISGKSISYEIKNRYGDIISFEHMGSLEYGQFGKKRPLFQDKETLQKYSIHKKYNSLPNDDGTIPEKDFTIYTYLNINQMSIDEEFTSVHSNILFSDVNMEEAIIHNGGYIGEVEYSNGKILVTHVKDKLCACKEYEMRK